MYQDKESFEEFLKSRGYDKLFEDRGFKIDMDDMDEKFKGLTEEEQVNMIFNGIKGATEQMLSSICEGIPVIFSYYKNEATGKAKEATEKAKESFATAKEQAKEKVSQVKDSISEIQNERLNLLEEENKKLSAKNKELEKEVSHFKYLTDLLKRENDQLAEKYNGIVSYLTNLKDKEEEEQKQE